MNLTARLTKLEQQKHRADAPQIIHVHGGLPGAEMMHATIGDQQIDRDAAEPLRDFEARAVASAKASRAAFVIIGGLPA